MARAKGRGKGGGMIGKKALNARANPATKTHNTRQSEHAKTTSSPPSAEETATMIAQHNARTPLLSLPAELRIMIYKLVMTEVPEPPKLQYGNKDVLNQHLSAHAPLKKTNATRQIEKNGRVFRLQMHATQEQELLLEQIYGSFHFRLVCKTINNGVQGFAMSAFTHDRRGIHRVCVPKKSLFIGQRYTIRTPPRSVKELRIIFGYDKLNGDEQWQTLASKMPELDRLILEWSNGEISSRSSIGNVMAVVRAFPAKEIIIAAYDCGSAYFRQPERIDEFMNALESSILRGRDGAFKFKSYEES